MGEKIIYHKTTYDIDSLYNLLLESGYDNIEKYNILREI